MGGLLGDVIALTGASYAEIAVNLACEEFVNLTMARHRGSPTRGWVHGVVSALAQLLATVSHKVTNQIASLHDLRGQMRTVMASRLACWECSLRAMERFDSTISWVASFIH